MSLTVKNAPYNVSLIETPKETLEEIIIKNPDLTVEDLTKMKTNNGNNLYAIAVISEKIQVTVYFLFRDETGKKPYANAQACLSKNKANGKEIFSIWCLMFEGNSRKPTQKCISVELNGFLNHKGENQSYVKVSNLDVPRYEINGIYVSTNEMNEIIRLKGTVAVYKPESFATGQETVNLKVPAKASVLNGFVAQPAISYSSVVVTPNQDVVKWKKMNPSDREALREDIKRSVNVLQTQLAQMELFEEEQAQSQEAEARRAIQEMAAARGMTEVTPQMMELIMAWNTN